MRVGSHLLVRSQLVILLALFCSFSKAAWVGILKFIACLLISYVKVGEEFWSTVYDNGLIQEGRSLDDFIHFKVVRDDLNVEAFIGFWLVLYISY